MALTILTLSVVAFACRNGDRDGRIPRAGSDPADDDSRGSAGALAGGVIVPDRAGALYVVSLGGDGVALLGPSDDAVIAYVSRGERRVYVDAEWTDRAHFLLGAYISVSTGLWRLPLPGDDARAPITPDDEAREFEAMDMDLLDPTRIPRPGDMRVRLGRPGSLDAVLECVPLGGESPGAMSGGPWEGRAIQGGEGNGGRELFGRLGEGRLHPTRACRGDAHPVGVYGWRYAPIRENR